MQSRPAKSFHKNDPGVPQALAGTLRFLRENLGAESVDELWIFPPLVQGRRERGLVVVSAFSEEDRRSVHTVTYLAEQTGQGISLSPRIEEEGEAPSDRLPRMINGVVHRAKQDLGEPRNFIIGGDAVAFDDVVAELDPETEAREGVA